MSNTRSKGGGDRKEDVVMGFDEPVTHSVPATLGPSGTPLTDKPIAWRALDLAGKVRSWAKWTKALGYPFDFTNSDAVPEPWMLDAIAHEWFIDPDGGWASEEEARFTVYEEVHGIDKALELLGEPPREVES